MSATGTYEATLEHARARDAHDALRGMRGRFELPRDARGRPQVYLAGHSLGAMPTAARALVNQELDDWARLAVLGHEAAARPWIPYDERLTAGLQHLTGALADEVVGMNSLTVNLHLMLASFYRPTRERATIVIEAGAFSSDRHAVASQLEWHGFDPAHHLIELEPPAGQDLIELDDIEALLERRGREIALVLWPGVQFRTGQAFDLERVVRAARRAGCRIGLDLAHSIGNHELALHDVAPDFAVWCSYKYLNAGPGALGGCFVHERHLEATGLPRLAGWWGHEAATRFQMAPLFEAARGVARWAISNPPILATAPLIASLDLFQEARIERLREKSVALTGFLEFLVRRYPEDIGIVTPSASARRGCQLSLRIAGGAERGRRVHRHLEELGAICDWRDPDIIRAAPVPLYNTFEDVFVFSGMLARALRETR